MFMQEPDVSDLWRLDVFGITDTSEKKSKKTLQKEIQDRFLQSVLLTELIYLVNC